MYFSETPEGQQVFIDSLDKTHEYFFAIVGINITGLLMDLLRNRDLEFQLFKTKCELNDLHAVYCKVYQLFNQFWKESKPKDIMEFSKIFSKFKVNLLNKFWMDELFGENKALQ